MKQSCDVIKDLLVLYEDDMCSEASKKVVEEHLKGCQECRTYYQKLQCTNEMISGEIKEEFVKEDKVMKQGFRKIRRRWRLSLTAVFMLIPALAIGILGYHEKRKEGIAFSNLDDIYRCTRYLQCIADGKFEKAAEMIDFSKDEYILVEMVADMTLEEYQEYMKEHFVKKMQEYDDLGIYIDNIGYDSAYRAEESEWTICISFDENYPDGSEQKIIVDLNGETMKLGASAYPHTGKVNMDAYIDEILLLYSEDDPLGYQDFEVTFEVKEGEKAIINLKNEESLEIGTGNIGLVNITYGTGTSLIREPYAQDSFVTSVPGKYSVFRYAGQMENVYLTKEDIDIQIMKYE